MSTHKHIDRICIVSLLLTLLLTLLFMNGAALGIEPMDSPADVVNTAGATEITLCGADAVISGAGAYLLDGDLCIAQGGTYVLSGDLADGGIVIDTGGGGAVRLLLNGLSAANSDGAAIRAERAGSVTVSLAEGSENTLESGEEPTDGTDGAVFSRADLYFCGSGALNVVSGYRHGIAANDNLTVSGGSITVTAPEDGLHANETLTVSGGALRISCGDDALHADLAVAISDGTVTAEDCYEGIEAVSITLSGGDVVIYPDDDGLNANGGGESLIHITGGNLLIDNPDGRDADGIDSNGSILVEGGAVRISVSRDGGSCALDCGTENGGSCRISGGTVIACGSSGMAEGFTDESTQCSIFYNVSAGGAAGDTLTLCDASGAELLRWVLPNAADSFVLSCPELTQGETYTLACGAFEESVTLSGIVTSNGGAAFGGFMGMGGGMPAGGFGGGGRPGADGAPADFGGGEARRQQMRDGMEVPEMPEGMQPPGMPDEMQRPQNFMPGGMPDGVEPSEEKPAPGGFWDGGGGWPQGDLRGEAQQIAPPDWNGTPDGGNFPRTLLLLGSSVLVLLAGLLIAAKFKGKN